MRILGIDPGLAITGWSIVDFDKKGTISLVDFGAIYTEKGVDLKDRLKEIHEDMSELLKNFKPEICGMETLLFYNNVTTAIAVGEARGVVLLSLSEYGIPLSEFTPLQVKSSITGYGKADKKQVQENVKTLCHLDELPKPDDAADAIAVAIACFDRIKMDKLKN
jgi:crossover junction endodeoxyribonuclease RuvC